MTRQYPFRVSHHWIRLGRALQVFFIWRCFVLIESPPCINTSTYQTQPTVKTGLYRARCHSSPKPRQLSAGQRKHIVVSSDQKSHGVSTKSKTFPSVYTRSVSDGVGLMENQT